MNEARVFHALLLSEIPVKAPKLVRSVKGWDNLSDKAKLRKLYRVFDDLIEQGFVKRIKVKDFYEYFPTAIGKLNYRLNVLNRLEAHLNG